MAELNLDNDYDSQYERLTSSRENTDLRALLDVRRAQRKQQAKNWPPIRATPKEEHLTQMHAQIDWLLAK